MFYLIFRVSKMKWLVYYNIILTGPGYLSLPTAVQRSLSVKGTPINVTCQLSKSHYQPCN